MSLSDWEVFLYRCSDCGTVEATTWTVTPPTHQATCATCNGNGHGAVSHLKHAIYLDLSTGKPMFRLLGWEPR